MIKWLAKKYVVNVLNDLLKSAKDRENIQSCKTKVVRIVKFLNTLTDVLDDNCIDDEETEKIIKEAKDLF